jgi:Trypsin-like peptidase domain
MFVNAIEEIQKYTRPVHTIVRHYHNNFIQPGAATLFFVNELGVAITCKHILDQLLAEHSINAHYKKFKAEKKLLGTKLDGKYKKQLKDLETKYNYTSTEAVAQLKNFLINCTDSPTFDYFPHPTLDLAILRFKNVTQYHYTSYAKFLKDGTTLKQGKMLCRFGFPFAEFTNFEYDTINDEINFTNIGNANSPSFPIDGIITRHVAEGQKIVGLEISTPGLRGQSGGPLFDTNGLVCGMQSHTVQYHMGFDEQKIEIISKGKRTNTINHSFLNVGRCIHVDAIKDFLKLHNVKYYEE